MRMRDALRVVEERRGDGVVVSTMTGNKGWNDVSHNPSMDLPFSGCMGKASSIALGIALAHPQKKTFVIDGDGSLIMNLGTLVTIGSKAPNNLVHILLENGVYGVTGGQPIPGATASDFAGMAREAGYRAAFDFKDLEDFATRADEVFKAQGPVFICLHVEPEIENTPVHLRPRPTRTTPIAIKELKASLAK